MSKRDLYSNITVTPAFLPQALSGTTNITGTVIDTKGYNSLVFILYTDAIAAGDVNAILSIEDDTAADGSSSTAVADGFLIGTEALTQIGVGAVGNQAKRIGYKGSKRYVRCDLVVTGNGGTDVVGCLAVLGHPVTAPTAADVAG